MPIAEHADRVFASGRTACDWETLFGAATAAEWELTVVCAAKDRERVERLARGRGEIHVEIPWAEHERLLRDRDLCVIAIEDRGLSAGHVRLMAAVEAGVPVVATDVPSLDGYAVAAANGGSGSRRAIPSRCGRRSTPCLPTQVAAWRCVMRPSSEPEAGPTATTSSGSQR